jgi:glycosyltransferase involved in cell wall biosynthesis
MSTLRLTRESIGLPMDAFVVGFVGSIFPWHGVDLLVDAIGALRSSGHKVVGLIVGDGQTVHQLKSRASAQGVADAIVWTGEVEHHDTWEYSRLADCLVMPRSNTYGSPIKLFEYALAKRPVIAPRNGPVSEVMEDGVHGLLIEPDVSQLAASILKLLSDPVLAENVSQAWYRRVVECHTWTRNAEQALVLSPEATLHKQ